MSHEKQPGPGQTQTPTDPAKQRAERVEALEAERAGYQMRGLNDRVKQVDEAIRAAKGTVKGRRTKDADEA